MLEFYSFSEIKLQKLENKKGQKKDRKGRRKKKIMLFEINLMIS